MTTGLSWLGIVRLGLAQSALGAIVMLTTSMLNRIMVVEYAMPALIPAGLVAWHYAVQLSRPKWGHSSDQGHRRTPWIIGGMGVLALGGMLATHATVIMSDRPNIGFALAALAFTMIGAGVGASGTSLLALLASSVAPARRPAAAALTWIMMIVGIVITAAAAGQFIDPFTPARLTLVAGCVTVAAFGATLVGVAGIEHRFAAPAASENQGPPLPFAQVMREIWADPPARHLTIFIFVSMLAYSAQDLILEPFAGLIFGYTPGQSTQMSSVQHMGVLIGMILVGVGGHAFGGSDDLRMRRWVIGGCFGSAAALVLLGVAGLIGPAAPLSAIVFVLGFANGVFAVAAIAAMMELAGAGGDTSRTGARMGLWGAAQAIAFGIGGFSGAAGLDAGRAILGDDAAAFIAVFSVEAVLFVAAGMLAFKLGRQSVDPTPPHGTFAGVTG
jgi:MFS transporter, BCD family, chlorophyll transporter